MQNEYKINLHAHTIFSDGRNSPYVMAVEAKKLGFTALVLTDHFYGNGISKSMSKDFLSIENRAVAEAHNIIPIIRGLEVPCCCQEVLIFGGSARKTILENGKPQSVDDLKIIKENHNCAIILCHPSPGFEIIEDQLDGYEFYNSGYECFNEKFSPKKLIHKPAWSNSDAHNVLSLCVCWNILNTKIVNESQLIKYIKSGKQPKMVCNGETK